MDNAHNKNTYYYVKFRIKIFTIHYSNYITPNLNSLSKQASVSAKFINIFSFNYYIIDLIVKDTFWLISIYLLKK